jgi:hypothetical protein
LQPRLLAGRHDPSSEWPWGPNLRDTSPLLHHQIGSVLARMGDPRKSGFWGAQLVRAKKLVLATFGEGVAPWGQRGGSASYHWSSEGPSTSAEETLWMSWLLEH